MIIKEQEKNIFKHVVDKSEIIGLPNKQKLPVRLTLTNCIMNVLTTGVSIVRGIIRDLIRIKR